MNLNIRFFLFLCLLFNITQVSTAQGQEKDTTHRKILDSKLSKEILRSVTRKPQQENVTNVKSEDIFKPYAGRIIRRINIRHIGFDRSIYDTTRNVRTSITRLANELHVDSRQSVIRDNLFFREGRPLNPYLLADNERYLRDLDFILDSRILVRPVEHGGDSVDVDIITRDVFSLGVKPRLKGWNEVMFGVYDANLMGYGQRLQADLLLDGGRSPRTGYDILYRKSSIAGSLINLTAGYTQLNNGPAYGEEYEYSYYLRLDRPLVSPYSRMAGGFEISKNWSRNVYASADSIFKNYRYDAFDIWTGYNIGIKNNMNNRSRHFVGLRYYDRDFTRQPLQPNEQKRLIYNDTRFLLGAFTFYRQNFYKTRYVYGFGRTEDIPYGKTVSLIAGWSEEIGRRRAYVGAYSDERFVRPSGRFYDIEFGGGTFLDKKGKSEDAVVYINGSYYSKLYPIGTTKVRHLLAAGYAKLFNNVLRDRLMLNSELPGFKTDSLFGYQRLHSRFETTIFTNWMFLGVHFAPFISLEGAFLQEKTNRSLFDNFYWGASGGMRVRNENLIFGTVEFRAFYFPTTVPGVSTISFKVTTNVRIKYSGSFVRAPDFVNYN